MGEVDGEGAGPDEATAEGPGEGTGDGAAGHPAERADGPAGGGGAPALRRGWTTGACATAAATAAYQALLTGKFPDPVTVRLPGGRTPAFALAVEALGAGTAMAGVVKDAGDDPDVTHGALVRATVRAGAPGTGVTFRAGPGVGTVTLPGLPLEVGEPAINPVPRRMIREAVARVAAAHGGDGDVVVEVSVDDGEEIARHTWNPRLGIVGGLSILGTTGVVIPYSCSAWIDSIRRGVDVAIAGGRVHVAGATGTTSERVAAERHGLSGVDLLDMGDFAGALLKYLRRHPIPRLTIAGGFAKLSKLADGHLDLHSGRSRVDLASIARRAELAGAGTELAAAIRSANTALHALQLAEAAGVPLGDAVARAARDAALEVLRPAPVVVDVIAVDRGGRVVGLAPPHGP